MSAFTRAGENGRLTLAVPAKGRKLSRWEEDGKMERKIT